MQGCRSARMQGLAWIHAFIVLLCCAATVESGLFEGSNVFDLDAESFESKVLNGGELWVIKWYAGWCGGCQMVAPWYTEAANLLKVEGINFGAMNMDVHAAKGRSYGVQGMPHIMAFHPGKPAPVGMAGLGGAQSIIDFARREHG
jgi:thiol-disulfide isomerase/thioredoxin